jgi:hypothetical protein
VYVPVRRRPLRLLLSWWALSGAFGSACRAANPRFEPVAGVKVGDAGAGPNAPDLGPNAPLEDGAPSRPPLDAAMVADSVHLDDVSTRIEVATPSADAAPATTDAATATTDAGTPPKDAATSTTDAALAAGLLAHWGFDQSPAGGSTTLVDPFGNTASLKGPITWSDDHPPSFNAGQSLAFNGGTSYVVLTLAPSQRPTSTGPLSVALWFKGTDPGPDTRTLIALYNQSRAPDVGLQLGVGATKIEGWPFGRSYRPLSMTTPTPRNVWHHVAYTFDNGTHLLYVDGLESSRSTWAGKAGVLDTVRLGTYDETSEPAFYLGLLSDVRLYDHPLGAAEVRALAGLPP